MRRFHSLFRLAALAVALGLAAAPETSLAKPVKHAAAAHGKLRHVAAKAIARHKPKARKASLAVLARRAKPLPEPDRSLHAYATCNDAPEPFVRAAQANAQSLDTLQWTPFGAPETGWQVYDLLVGREIGATCGSGTAVFAQKLAAFQAKYNLPADGVFTPATFEVVKGLLQERRPFVMARVAKICPDAPAEGQLVAIPKEAETFQREDRRLRADVWEAYQHMLAAARAELPQLKDDPRLLTIFSAYRSPDSDAVRCETQGNCDGLRRAVCSAHRTGAALDLDVGWVEGVSADSTTPENRLLQTRAAPYRWLVMNAARFGFVNYPYEPWHWEWVGDAAAAAAPAAAPAQAAPQAAGQASPQTPTPGPGAR